MTNKDNPRTKSKELTKLKQRPLKIAQSHGKLHVKKYLPTKIQLCLKIEIFCFFCFYIKTSPISLGK